MAGLRILKRPAMGSRLKITRYRQLGKLFGRENPDGKGVWTKGVTVRRGGRN